MLIILEGVDMAGKTTLQSELVRMLALSVGRDVVRMNRGPIKEHPLDEYVRPLLDYRPGTAMDVICDRWHLGELIYGPMLRGESKLTPPLYRYVEMWLASRGACVVHCHENTETLIKRFQRRGDDLVNREQIIDVAHRYVQLFHDRPPYVSYRSSKDFNSDGVLNIIGVARKLENEATTALNYTRTFVGAPMFAKVLLVGDTRNSNPVWPSAFVPFESTSGHYLMRALDEAGYETLEVAMLNACDDGPVRGKWIQPYELKTACTLGTNVVALGNNAHERLDEADIAHGAVPHPQWWRRFAHHELQRYAELLRRAANEQEDLRSCRP